MYNSSYFSGFIHLTISFYRDFTSREDKDHIFNEIVKNVYTSQLSIYLYLERLFSLVQNICTKDKDAVTSFSSSFITGTGIHHVE